MANASVLTEDGLRRAGHDRLADEISARFLALCETRGFAENLDALTGTGLRDRVCTWTAAHPSGEHMSTSRVLPPPKRNTVVPGSAGGRRLRRTTALAALFTSVAAGVLPGTSAQAADTAVTVDFSTAGG